MVNIRKPPVSTIYRTIMKQKIGPTSSNKWKRPEFTGQQYHDAQATTHDC